MSIMEPKRRGRPKNKIPRNPPRKLYKIDQVIKMLDLTGRTIRYYDQVGLLPHIKRSDGGIRLFDDQDIELIKKIRKIQREAHLPLSKIKEVLFQSGGDVNATDKWVVLTDTSAALSSEIIVGLPIAFIPLTIHLGQTQTEDPQTHVSKLWEKAHAQGTRPLISAPTETDFVTQYRTLATQGYTRIYSVHISSALSDTYANALSASHKVGSEIEVVVVDSRSAGAGLGLFVRLLAQSIAEKASSTELTMLLEKQVPLLHNLILVNSMDMIFPQDGFVATRDSEAVSAHPMRQLMEFKPVLSLKHKTGKLDIDECCKDKLVAMRLMVELLESEVKSRGGYIRAIMVSYSYLYGEAVALANEFKSRYHNAEIMIVESGSAMSAYTGPQVINVGII